MDDDRDGLIDCDDTACVADPACVNSNEVGKCDNEIDDDNDGMIDCDDDACMYDPVCENKEDGGSVGGGESNTIRLIDADDVVWPLADLFEEKNYVVFAMGYPKSWTVWQHVYSRNDNEWFQNTIQNGQCNFVV
jgi:hypothetical protein